MKYTGGFKCDIKAKEIMKHLIEDIWFSAFSITYDTDNENNPMALIDTIFTATSNSGKQYKYAIELKERPQYEHNKYDWMLELPKYKILYNTQYISGYTSAYLNTFKDDIYALWTIKDIDKCKIESTVYANKTTQGNDNTIINKLSYLLPFNNATITGYTNEQEYISNNSRRKIDRTTD